MTINISRTTGIAIAAFLVVVVAVSVVFSRHGNAATVKVAPLSATDRQVLTASRPLIESLPKALAEVTTAASDASHGRATPSQALTIINNTSGLSSLSEAIANPQTVTKALTDAYVAVVAGRSPGSVDDLAPALEELQAVEGQIEPAIRISAAHGKVVPSAGAALSSLEHDRQVPELARLVVGWQQVYGAFTLVEQEAAGS